MKMKKIAVIGSGYVGLVTAACLAEIGHHVSCMDVDEKKIQQLKQGRSHLFEPGLEPMIQKNLGQKRLSFTTNTKEAILGAEAIYVAVGTPEKIDGAVDLSYIHQAIHDIAPSLGDDTVIIIKSTVPVGTHQKITAILLERTGRNYPVVSNPEFLREGSALNDFLFPDRIVIGALTPSVSQFVETIYSTIKAPIFHTDPKSAELIKYASNAFLATKISFINEIAGLCEKAGGDIEQVAAGMGMDPRIGEQFLRAGIGYGGSCFPKDTKALVKTAGQFHHPVPLLSSVIAVNDRQQRTLIQKGVRRFGSYRGKRIAILGLSFKPNTDDVRESPALKIMDVLQKRGAFVTAYDPVVNHVEGFQTVKTVQEALMGADLAMICTDWKTIVELPLSVYEDYMREPVIFDGRNCYDLESLQGRKIEYHSIGRQPYIGL